MVPDFSRPLVSYRGEDAGEMFVRKLQEEAEQLFQEYIDTPQQLLELTDAKLHSFHTTTNCHRCNQLLGGNKVHDHCHIVGNNRGAAHRCNLVYRISKSEWKLPVVMHNLRDKARYVVHYRNLKLYLQLGFVVTRIHRVLVFKQSTWLKTYIDFNNHQRSLARSSFLKDFFKLMNNSVFGKTQENLRKHVQVELITDAAILSKRVAKYTVEATPLLIV